MIAQTAWIVGSRSVYQCVPPGTIFCGERVLSGQRMDQQRLGIAKQQLTSSAQADSARTDYLQQQQSAVIVLLSLDLVTSRTLPPLCSVVRW